MENDSHITIALPPISPAAPGPLYAQIVAGVKREVAGGRLAAGDALPSFRALAEVLMVSLITVKRAYEELEHDGIIYRKQGLGTYVSEDGAARCRDAHRTEVRELLKNAVEAAARAGMADVEVTGLLHQLQQEAKE